MTIDYRLTTMSFLYPAFLAGAVAIALPIALHFLRRDVAPEVPFSAVRLLRRSPIERSHRRRLRDLLLLAARVAALFLLAAAFARPYLTAAGPSPLRLVAIDRSFSMDAGGRFSRAVDLARRAIADAGVNDRIALVAFDDRAELLAPPGGAADARAALARIQPAYGATRYAVMIAKAVEIADGQPARLVVITDLQRSGWDDEQPGRVPAGLDVQVVDAGAMPPNLAVTALQADSGRLVATIRNAGSMAHSGQVQVWRDGQTVAGGRYSIAADRSTKVPIDYRLPSTGSIAVAVEDPSGPTADNTRYAVLDAAARPRIAIVTSAGAAQSGFYLSRALDAVTDAADSGSGFSSRLISGTALSAMAAGDFELYRAIVLLSTRGLDRHARETLAAAVRRGAGLLIAAAPDVEPTVLSTTFGYSSFGNVEQEPRAVSLSATDLRHPIFRPFGALAANLGQVRFDRTWRLRGDGWNVAARFTDGAPALLERREGAGKIVLFASDLDRAWNDFPLHPAFVPFAVEAVRYVSGVKEGGREYLVARAPATAGAKPGIYAVDADKHAIAVNVDVRESETARLSADEFTARLDREGAAPTTNGTARAQQTEARQSYWRYGLLLMLVTLVAESFIGRA